MTTFTDADFDTAREYLAGKDSYGFDDLLLIVRMLRSPRGCPWDREQTHSSIRADLLEETYELAEAIDLDSTELLREETGDVLLQTVLHSQISSEEGRYDMNDVVNELCNKLIIRHPHVFGTATAEGSGEALANWDAVKSATKGRKTVSDKMRSVARTLPALMRADAVGAKSKKASFDFNSPEEAAAKVREELGEVMSAVAQGGNVEEEIGDLLFSAVNLARVAGVEPEEALTRATDKFIDRFTALEKLSEDMGADIASLGQQKADELWEKIKKNH